MTETEPTRPNRCETCLWFDKQPTHTRGQCRVNPPMAGLDNSVSGNATFGFWPLVKPNDWCKQHEFR